MFQAPSEHIRVAALIEKAFWLYLVGGSLDRLCRTVGTFMQCN